MSDNTEAKVDEIPEDEFVDIEPDLKDETVPELPALDDNPADADELVGDEVESDV